MKIKQLKLGGDVFAPLTVAEAVLVENNERLDQKLDSIESTINTLPTNSAVLLKEHAPENNDVYFGTDNKLHVSVDLSLFVVLSNNQVDSDGKPNVNKPLSNKIYLTPQGESEYKEWLYVEEDWEEIGFLDTVEVNLESVTSSLNTLSSKVSVLENSVENIQPLMITADPITVNGSIVDATYDINFTTIYGL